MIALQYQRPGKLIQIQVPIPEPRPDEVCIQVAYAGVCGTDIHILAEESPAASEVVLGHEFSGRITAVGNRIQHLQTGDAVAVNPNNHCGDCDYCRKGQIHFCRNLKPFGIFRDGGWSEYCIVPAQQVYKLPETLSLEWGALCEPLSCIIHGWDRLHPIPANASVLIIGAGIIGLLWALLLREKANPNLVISEPDTHRRQIAENLGMIVEPPQRIEGRLSASRAGFDLIIDCSGNPAAIEQAFQWTNLLGKFLLFGICPQGSLIQIHPFQIFNKELTLIGSVINPHTFQRAIDIMADIQQPIENLGVRYFPLSEYPQAIEAMKSGKITRAMFTPGKKS